MYVKVVASSSDRRTNLRNFAQIATNKMKYWIIADTHYNHKNLVEWGRRKEGFGDLLNKGLLEKTSLAHDGVQMVIHLGDFCMGDEAEAMEKFVASTPNCKRVLVRGNHDGKSENWYLTHGFDFVCSSFTLRHLNKDMIFTHRPVPQTDKYDINIHGHLHGYEYKGGDGSSLDKTWHYDCAPEIRGFKPLLLERIIKDQKQSIKLIKNKENENNTRE